MFYWTKKIKWGKVFVAAFIYLIIANIIRQIEIALTINYYQMPEYFGVWSTIMMPATRPPPMSFFLVSLSITLITGIALAAFYDFIKEILPKKFWQKVISFTDIVIGLMLVLSYLPMYLLINLPLGLLGYWFVSNVIITFLNAIIFAKILG